jgi:predicted lipoprotein with Yx(FWY)xxD motif
MKIPLSPVRAVALAAALALLVAGCATATRSTPSAGSGGPPAVAAVNTASGPLGTYLTDSRGRALYLWVADTAGTSTCAGACAATWPPVTTAGAPMAGTGVDAAKLGTVARGDGTTQVTYDKHPLYLFALDMAAGDVKGQGSTGFGAAWWLVTPDGTAITTPLPATDGGAPMGGY